MINGVVDSMSLSGTVATLFTGSDSYVDKVNITDTIMSVISHWGNG